MSRFHPRLLREFQSATNWERSKRAREHWIVFTIEILSPLLAGVFLVAYLCAEFK